MTRIALLSLMLVACIQVAAEPDARSGDALVDALAPDLHAVPVDAASDLNAPRDAAPLDARPDLAAAPDAAVERDVEPEPDMHQDAEAERPREVDAEAPCVPDELEPNDRQEGAVDLDQHPAISQGGLVLANVDHELPDALRLCPGDEDWFCLSLQAGDGLLTSVANDGDRGSVELSLHDEEGGVLARGNARPGDQTSVIFRGALRPRLCIRVGGRRDRVTPYRLRIRRSRDPVALACEPAEDPVDDTPEMAGPLAPAVGAQGLICGADEDWYAFEVGEGDRLCARVDGFDRMATDLDLTLYSTEGARAGECAGQGCAEQCVLGRCREPLGSAAPDFDLVQAARGSLAAGDYLLRVARGPGPAADAAYDLSLALQGRDHRCEPPPLDDLVAPAARCTDCVDAQRVSAFFSVLVMARQDISVVACVAPGQGSLSLDYDGPPHPDAQADPFDAGYRQAREPGACQCINVKGGERDALANLSVGPNVAGPPRMDFALFLLPTDLVANDNRGACVALGAADLPPCPEDPGDHELLLRGCWPVVRTP